MLRTAPALTLLVMLGPLAAGLVGTLGPAFGYLPALGGDRPTLEVWRDLAAAPGLGHAVRTTLLVGFGATGLAFVAVMAFCAAWQGTRAFALLRRLLSPLLSVPHAATALALAFLIAPSGWLMRLLSPWATGFERPPDLLIVHDTNGLALLFGLAVKEMPFLLLMTIAALGQVDAERRMTLARTLGYGRMTGWLKAVLPGVYGQLRLPVYAVLAYSLSVVDMALILGPTNPPTLPVLILRWAADPDLAMRFTAAAGALLQLLLVAAAILAWHGLERLVSALGCRALEGGRRHNRDATARRLALLPVALGVLAVLAGLISLALWSIAEVWRFPAALPQAWSLDSWRGHLDAAARTAGITAAVAVAATAVAAILAVGCLENESRREVAVRRALVLIYLPLLVPQIAFLFGLQVLLTLLGIDGSLGAVIWAHLVFVLPYVFLALSDPYRSYDGRYTRTALCLGATPTRFLWTVKLPMLLRALLTAMAVGFAVSVGQYLPTLFAGAGRVATVTTEAVALAASADRRLIGVFALLQAVLPFVGFALAVLLPGLLYRHRRGMQVQ